MPEYLNLRQAREVAQDRETLAELISLPYDQWAKRCHEISMKLLKTGRFGPGRVARGWASGVRGQHSWLVLGHDVYAPGAICVDPTIWHWRDKPERGILVDKFENMTGHRPHGQGSIWVKGRPAYPTGTIIELTPSFELSEEAQLFLSEDVLGPLDRAGWAQLANGAMEEWPSAEIIAAMDDTPALRSLVPIDILGMLTSRNPGDAYLVEGLSPYDVAPLDPEPSGR